MNAVLGGLANVERDLKELAKSYNVGRATISRLRA